MVLHFRISGLSSSTTTSRRSKLGKSRMMKSANSSEIEPNCWDLNTRLKDMNRDTDVQVLCTVPVMFSYRAKA